MDPKAAVRLDRTVGRQVYALHRGVYRLTAGRIGHRTRTGPILLLTTVGRRSGKQRTTPLLYFVDGEDYVVVASNGGRDAAPSWLLNLSERPEVTIQVGRSSTRARAEVLDAQSREALWPRLTEFYTGWGYYENLTDRKIPVVALRPA